MGEEKRQYETPAIIIEFNLETRAGSPVPTGSSPLDNILLSEALGLDSPLE